MRSLLHHDALAATKYAFYVYNHAVRRKESDLMSVFVIFEFNVTLNLMAMKKIFCLWRKRHCVRATQFLLRKCCGSGKPLATLGPIWPAQVLILKPPAPETNALPLHQRPDLYQQIHSTQQPHCFGSLEAGSNADWHYTVIAPRKLVSIFQQARMLISLSSSIHL